jgi:hypothetical protein
VALYAGASRVDGSATLTSTVSPTSGALSSLSDGAFTATVRWDEPPALPAGFALVWDFGVGATADITSVGIAGPTQMSRLLHRFVLQSGDDGVAWSADGHSTCRPSKFPGAAAFYTLLVADYASYRDNVVLLLTMDGPDGGTRFTDLVGNNSIIPIGAAQTRTTQSKSGGSALSLDGSSYLRCNTLAAKLVSTYTMEGWFYLTALLPGQNQLFGLYDAVGENVLVVTSGLVFGANIATGGYTDVALNGWHHVAACRQPTLTTVWIDGALVASRTSSDYVIQGDAIFTIGQDFDVGLAETDYMQGYVDYFSVTNEVRYTAPFTPRSLPDYDPTPLRVGPYFGPPEIISAFDQTPVTQALISPSPASLDFEHFGSGRVVGTTHNVGAPNYPVSRRVRLLRKRDGVLAREVWSDAAGHYIFDQVRPDIEYVVMAHDHTGLYNAEVSDSIDPEVV